MDFIFLNFSWIFHGYKSIVKIFIFSLYYFVVVILTGGSLSAIACVLVEIPIVQIGFLILFLCTGITGNVVNLSTVDLFPTSLRAMAVCISLMFGRLGGVVGANVTALLLYSHCEYAFFVPAVSLMGEQYIHIHQSLDQATE